MTRFLLVLPLLIALGLASSTRAGAASDTPSLLVEIRTDDVGALATRLEQQGFDVLHGLPSGADTRVQLVLNEVSLAALRAQGLDLEIVARGRPFADIAAERGDLRDPDQAPAGAADGSIPTGYPNLAQIEADMAAFAASHPTLCSLVDLTASLGLAPTIEGRHLHAVKISDNVSQDEDEPAVLIVSAHHCRELVTPVIALDAIARLLNGYGSDAEITALVDQYEIWIAPVWNPDGYNHVFTVDNFWRKNRHVFPTAIGVDLNRNYPFGWSISPCAGTTDPIFETFKGESPASEAETQTMLALTAERHFQRVMDFHSSGTEVLWGNACLTNPLDVWLEAEAVALSFAFGYAGDERPPSADGEHYEWQLSMGAYSFLTETANEFQPPFATALAEAAQVWPGTLEWMQRPVALSGHVRDACTGLPLDDALVDVLELSYLNGEAGSRSGGAFGRYHVFVPGGNWTIAVSAPGYTTQTFPLTVTIGSQDVIDVELVPLAPAGCFEDLLGAKAGVAGIPNLDGVGTLVPGEPQVLLLTDAASSAGTTLVVGLQLLGLPFKGGTLIPDPFAYLAMVTDAGGGLTLPFALPIGTPLGTEVFLQAWIVDGTASFSLAASNGLKLTTG